MASRWCCRRTGTKTISREVEILIYALGGGFGHLTRAAALARALPATRRVCILTNSPHAGMVQVAVPALDVRVLDPALNLEHARAAVLQQIKAAAPDCLVVDTFPRGLVGELAGVLSEKALSKVLVRRDLNPQYVEAFGLEAVIEHAYDLVLIPGDGAEGPSGCVVTAPWLVRSHEELLPRDAARRQLRLQNNRPCVLVCAAGNVDELGWYGEVTARLLAVAPDCEVRCIAPARPEGCPMECWVAYWPAMELYAAVDVVVGGGGYNTVHECQACGVPLVARPWSRKYDRQRLRAERSAVTIIREPAEAVEAALRLARSSSPSSIAAPFDNGALHGAKFIEELRRSVATDRDV